MSSPDTDRELSFTYIPEAKSDVWAARVSAPPPLTKMLFAYRSEFWIVNDPPVSITMFPSIVMLSSDNVVAVVIVQSPVPE